MSRSEQLLRDTLLHSPPRRTLPSDSDYDSVPDHDAQDLVPASFLFRSAISAASTPSNTNTDTSPRPTPSHRMPSPLVRSQTSPGAPRYYTTTTSYRSPSPSPTRTRTTSPSPPPLPLPMTPHEQVLRARLEKVLRDCGATTACHPSTRSSVDGNRVRVLHSLLL